MTGTRLQICGWALTGWALFSQACAKTVPEETIEPDVRSRDEIADDKVRKEIEAQIERFFSALQAKHLSLLRDLFAGDLPFYAVISKTEEVEVRRTILGQYLKELEVDPHDYRERMWKPVIYHRRGLAMVWAPYEFIIDGKRSHCGIDAFTLVNIKGTWKISGASFTVESSGCAELQATHASPR